MHTAEYKFQVGQTVFVTDFDDDELKQGIVLQVTIDIYQESSTAVTLDNTYIIQLLTGMDCSENIEVPESSIYATLEEAAAALQPHIGDE